MKFIVQNPPDPTNGQFSGTSPLPWQRAMASWAQNLNGRLQQSFPLNYGAYVQGPKFGQLPIFGTQRWNGAYPNSFIIAGNGVSISGTSTVAINANVAAIVAGTNIAISGTGTQTIALASNVINSFPARTPIAGTNYSIQTSDYLVAYTTLGTAGNTVSFPAPSSLNRRAWIVKDEGGFAGTSRPITLQSTSGTNTYTFDGASAKTITSAYGDLRVYSNGLEYFTW
jgi:hypothetical protein